MLFRFLFNDGGDYRQVLRKRRRLLFFTLPLGLATLAADLLLIYLGTIGENYASGFYAGVGSGVTVASICGILYLNGILKDDKKLRAKQIKETDERAQLVLSKALSTTALIAAFLLYLAILILAPFHKELSMALAGSFFLFLLIFSLSKLYYEKKL